MLFCLNWLWKLLLDERGEGEGEGSGEGSSSGNGEGSEQPGEGAGGGHEGEGEGEGSEEQPGAGPKYGEFGDNPTVDDIYAALGKQKTDHENFRKKAGLTESNLGKLRQTLDRSGITISEDGQLQLKEQPKKEAPKTRFTDSHLKDLAVHFQNSPDGAKAFLELIAPYFEDMMDGRLTSYSQKTRAQQKAQEQWNKTYDASLAKTYKTYPNLQKEIGGKPNPTFNQAHLELTNKMLNDPSTGYARLPNGDWLAAHEAAGELGISPIAIEKAKVEGYNKGKQIKRVLGPAGGGKQKTAPGARLSKAEYLKLTPEQKEKYDRETMDSKVT